MRAISHAWLFGAPALLTIACHALKDEPAEAMHATPAFGLAYEQSLWTELDAHNCGEARYSAQTLQQEERFARLKQIARRKGLGRPMQEIEKMWHRSLELIERDCPHNTVHWRDFQKALDQLELQISKIKTRS